MTKPEGLLVVLSAPSGSGKDTVGKIVREMLPDMVKSVSATTRQPRPGEVHGKDYFYMTKEEFDAMDAAGGIMERTLFNRNYYGTPRHFITEMCAQGKDVLMVIDVVGGRSLKKMGENAVYICIAPPSFEVLEQRLVGRGTETKEQIAGRLARAKEELEELQDYEYLVVNDDAERCARDVCAIIRAEHLKMANNRSHIADMH